MPYLSESEIEKQRRLQQEGGQPSVAGPSGLITGTGGPAKGVPTKSGSFTNLNSYLDANKEQAGDMGSKVADKIVQYGSEARSEIDKAKNTFNQKVNEGSLTNLDQAKSDAERIVGQAKALSAGQKFDDSDIGRFKQIGSTAYQGPRGFEDVGVYQPTQAAVKKSQDYSKLSESDSGRYALLDEIFSKPTYNAGQRRLDNLLLSGSDDAKQSLSQARQNVADVGDEFLSATQESQQFADNRAKQIDETKSFANQLAQKAASDFQSSIDERVNTYNQRRNALDYGAIRSDLADVSDLDLDLMRKLGLNSGYSTYGLELNNYFTDSGEGDRNRIASKDDVARAKALASIMDGAAPYLSDESQAGTQVDPFTFDLNRYNQDRSAREKDYRNEYVSAPDINSLVGYDVNQTRPQAWLDWAALGDNPLVTGSSWERIENTWIPIYRNAEQRAAAEGQPGYYGRVADKLQAALDQMRAKHGYDKVINVGQKGGDLPSVDPRGRTIYYK